MYVLAVDPVQVEAFPCYYACYVKNVETLSFGIGHWPNICVNWIGVEALAFLFELS